MPLPSLSDEACASACACDSGIMAALCSCQPARRSPPVSVCVSVCSYRNRAGRFSNYEKDRRLSPTALHSGLTPGGGVHEWEATFRTPLPSRRINGARPTCHQVCLIRQPPHGRPIARGRGGRAAQAARATALGTAAGMRLSLMMDVCSSSFVPPNPDASWALPQMANHLHTPPCVAPHPFPASEPMLLQLSSSDEPSSPATDNRQPTRLGRAVQSALRRT